MAKSTILRHLSVEKDLSINREPLSTGRVRHMRHAFKANYSKMLIMSLLLVLFALPAIVFAFLLPNVDTAATADLNFSGNIGIGYPGAIDDASTGMLIIYDIRIQFLAIMIPCIMLFGVGCAGAFYCARNVLWGVPIKLRKHFWRGIKLYWWQFLLSFTAIGGVVFGVGCAVIYNLKLMTLGTANAGSWILMIFALIFGLVFLIYMLFLLPMIVCYKIKFWALLKNCALFTISLFPTNILTVIGLGIPFLLLLVPFLSVIFLMAMAMLGFSFYILWISAYGQFAFDNFINTLYEAKEAEANRKLAEQRREQKKKSVKNGTVSPVKSYKKKKKQ